MPWMQKIEVRLLSKLPKLSSFIPESGQNIALHALPTARDSAFVISAFPVYSIVLFFQSSYSSDVYYDECIRLVLL